MDSEEIWLTVRKFIRRSLWPLALVLVLNAMGFTAVFCAVHMRLFTQLEAKVFITLMILPSATFVLVSGKIKQFKAAGIEAEFFEQATTNLLFSGKIALPVESAAKGGMDALEAKVREYETRADPLLVTALELDVSKQGYDRDLLITYLERLSKASHLRYITFRHADIFLGYLLTQEFRSLLLTGSLRPAIQAPGGLPPRDFVHLLNEGDAGIDHLRPFLRRAAPFKVRGTNIEALRQMQRTRCDAVIIKDDNNVIKGIADRDQVVADLVVALGSDQSDFA
jgi:hypothetical protein